MRCTATVTHVLLAIVCLLPACLLFAADIAKPARPNILLVVTDDMGYGDATCYWNTDLQTPAIDSVARNGIRFTQFRVNPLCAPTRASILTGLYSVETGMWRGPLEKFHSAYR